MSRIPKAQRPKDPYSDFPTPGWCPDRFIERMLATEPWFPRDGLWLEPTAGAGRIIRRFQKVPEFARVRWHAWDIQARYLESLQSVSERALIVDALKFQPPGGASKPYALAITNPPFPLAQQLLQAMRAIAHNVVLLLRINFLSSAKRQPFFTEGGMPHRGFVLPDRPKFRYGEGDCTEYAWFAWDDNPHTETVMSVLALTPKDERLAWESVKETT